MKKIKILILILLLSCITYSQNGTDYDNSKSKIDLVVIPKLGFAKVSSTGFAPTNGFISGGDVLVSFKLSKSSILAAGIGFNEFYANVTNAGNNFSLKNSYLRFPVNYITNFVLFNSKPENNTTFLSIGIGIYGNNLINQKLESASDTNSENNLGWNAGLSTYLGIKYNVTDLMNLGIGMETNKDLFRMKKNGVEQKVDNSITLNLTLGYKLN